METLKTFQAFVDEITSSNSRLFKESVLTKYKDDEAVKYYLNFIYNPYIITGISDKKLHKKLDGCAGEIDVPHDVKEMLEYIKVNNTGRDIDLLRLANFEYFCFDEPWMEELFNKIVIKNLPLGIDAKTINKVIPGLIPEFNVMLANKYFEKPEVVEGKAFAITTKIDGSRIIALKENGVVSFYSRQGQEYEGLVDLEEEMKTIMPDNICLDGELTLLDPGKLTSKEQYKETMKISRKDGEKHGLKMLVFDIMPVSDFKAQKSSYIYSERRAMLDELFMKYNLTYFDCLPVLYEGTDTEEIIKWLDYNTSHGEEGVMINLLDAKYEFKRTNALLKVKKFQDIDLEIIGFEEGTGQNTGKLGAVLVRYKDGNVVKVGSGFTNSEIYDKDGNLIHQDDRKEIWNHQSEWLGRIISIRYFEETTNQNGGKSLRFPIYVDWRSDKLTPDF